MPYPRKWRNDRSNLEQHYGEPDTERTAYQHPTGFPHKKRKPEWNAGVRYRTYAEEQERLLLDEELDEITWRNQKGSSYKKCMNQEKKKHHEKMGFNDLRNLLNHKRKQAMTDQHKMAPGSSAQRKDGQDKRIEMSEPPSAGQSTSGSETPEKMRRKERRFQKKMEKRKFRHTYKRNQGRRDRRKSARFQRQDSQGEDGVEGLQPTTDSPETKKTRERWRFKKKLEKKQMVYQNYKLQKNWRNKKKIKKDLKQDTHNKVEHMQPNHEYYTHSSKKTGKRGEKVLPERERRKWQCQCQYNGTRRK